MSAEAPQVVVYRQRRNVELLLVLLACALGVAGYLSAHANLYHELAANVGIVAAIWFGLGIGLHLIVRWRAAWADPVLLPSVMLLNGMGLAMIYRIDQISDPVAHGAESQLAMTVLGMLIFAGIVIGVRDYRGLQRYPYVMFIVGMALLLLPLVPGIGAGEINGARIWIRVGSFSFQPAEIAKIVLAIAFASYLADHRTVLSQAGGKILGISVPRPRDLAPILIMWAAAVVVLIYQNDLGTSLMFFGLFVMMLYVATEQISWPLIGGLLFVAAALLAVKFVPHVGRRISAWLHPFDDFDRNAQVINAQFGMAWGGLTGRGWGLGRPGLTTFARSDMMPAAIGEELGVTGLMAVIVIYAVIVSRGLRASLTTHEPFGKLLAAGLSFTLGLQVFVIIGGVTRLLPLTGLTTPFMSQGGSSLISNWAVIAGIVLVSHQARRPSAPTPPRDALQDGRA